MNYRQTLSTNKNKHSFLSCAQSNFAQLIMSDSLFLKHQLGFPLYALSRQMIGLYRPYLEPLDLTYPQYLVMLLLWEHDRLLVKDISEQLWLDSGTLTPMLKRLEDAGLIHRSRCPEDERCLYADCSDAGKQLKIKAKRIPINILAEIDVSSEELHDIQNHLNLILGKIKKLNKLPKHP